MAAFYPPLLASGVNNLGRFDQFDLYAGEDDIVTSQAQAADGVAIRQFEIVTFDVDGRLIPWAATGQHSSATITFTGQPTAADTITINGVVIDFVSSLTPGDNDEVLIGATAPATVANLVSMINGTPDGVDPNTLLPTYGVSSLAGTGVTATVDTTGLIVTLSAAVEGTAGNALTLTESASNVTVSGAVLSGAEADRATGNITFTAVATATQTVTINGNVVTFMASGATGNNQINIGATATDSAQNLRTLINAYPGIYGVTAAGAGPSLSITAIAEGTPGNAITLARSNTNPTISGATLTGGGASEPDAALAPIGIAAQPVSATTPGTWLPYFCGGVFNHQVLIWPAGVATLAQRKRAVASSPIKIGQLL